MRKDLVGDHVKLLEDPDHNMKYFLVKVFTEACSEVRKRCFTGQILQTQAGISPVGSSLVLIPEQGKDIVAVEVPVKEAKEIDQEEAGRIIARGADMGVTIGNEASNEGEVDERGDHLGVATPNGAIREDLHKSFFELVV